MRRSGDPVPFAQVTLATSGEWTEVDCGRVACDFGRCDRRGDGLAVDGQKLAALRHRRRWSLPAMLDATALFSCTHTNTLFRISNFGGATSDEPSTE